MRKLTVLLPCHSLDDFPTHHTGLLAEGLLVNWTATWHPMLIHVLHAAPSWTRTDAIDLTDTDATFLCPTVSRQPSELSSAWAVNHAELDLLEDYTDRSELVHELLGRLDAEIPVIEPSLVMDFYALGYWYLQLELFARQVRYHSNLDSSLFFRHVVMAAAAAFEDRVSDACEQLQRCFTMLAEQRDQYYPVDAYLLDLTLVAESTTADEVYSELAGDLHRNVWMSGRTAELFATREPKLMTLLRSQLTADDESPPPWAIVGGDWEEAPLALLDAESVCRQWRRGRKVLQRHLDTKPSVYFRRRFGASPRMAGLLAAMQYQGMVAATLDAGRFPESSQSRSQLSIAPGEQLDAVSCIPLDGSLPETFLNFTLRMGKSMDMDHVATICLAHWAGRASRWYDEMLRGAKYGLDFGRPTTIERYLRETDGSSYHDEWAFDQFRSPYLRQDINTGELDPISRHVRRTRRATVARYAATLTCWAEILNDQKLPWSASLEDALDCLSDGSENEWPSDARVRGWMDDATSCLAGAITGQSPTTTARPRGAIPEAADGPPCIATSGILIINPASAATRSTVELPSTLRTDSSPEMPISTGASTSPIYASTSDEKGTVVITDSPALGFAWLEVAPRQSVHDASKKGRHPPASSLIVEEWTLRNEFVAATVDDETGGLLAFRDFHTRGNRLGQRLTWGSQEHGSRMLLDERTVVQNSPCVGSVHTRGRLLNESDSRLVANFEQTFTLSRGSRLIRLDIVIQATDELGTKPWSDYLACRWALPRESFDLYRGMHGMPIETAAKRCESPDWFEIVQPRRRTEILTGGLPYHHRSGPRFLDSLLLVSGERETQFSLAFAADLPQLATTADNWWMQATYCLDTPHPRSETGWMFHIDAKHVVATGWQSVPLDSDDESLSGCRGFRVRLMETAGKSGPVLLRGPRTIRSAARTDFQGAIVRTVPVGPDGVRIEMRPYEWTEVECHW